MNDLPSGVADQAGDYATSSPLSRLKDARWQLLALLGLSGASVVFYELPINAVLAALLLMVFVIAFLPRRPRSRRLEVVKQRELRRMWPGTGMKLTVDALPSPCFVADGRGITRYINRAALRNYGDLKAGDPLSFFLRAPSVLEAFDRVCSSGSAERITWSEKAPTEAWYEAYVSPVFMPKSASGGKGAARPDFVLVVIHDQTEQRRLERMRSDFVANASHELRTPLASLSGFIETLQGPAKDDAVARERFLSIMQEQAERMRRLIDDILSLSRIELKAHVRPSSRVDLAGVVRHTVDALGPVAKDLGIQIETEVPDTEVLINGDRDELIQVLENLIENALKYGASGGKITVSLAADPTGRAQGCWALSVTDYGEGIPSEHLPRLTERFYRVPVKEGQPKKGTGLGLAIVKHILNRHRARLDIESTAGKGTTFRSVFPALGDN